MGNRTGLLASHDGTQIIQIDPNDPQDVEFWGKNNPAALAVVQGGRKERATAYVCQNFACRAPTSDPEVLERSLRQANVPVEMTSWDHQPA